MPNCKGYGHSCWIEKSIKSKHYCDSCEKEKLLDEFNTFESFDSSSIPLLRKFFEMDSTLIDAYLPDVYEKSKREDWEQIYRSLFEKTLQNKLAIRIRSHIGGEFCKIVKWMIRNKKLDNSWISQNCVICQSNYLAWGHGEVRKKARSFFIQTIPDFFTLASSRLYRKYPLEYATHMKEIVNKVLDFSHLLYVLLKPRIIHKEILGDIEEHPIFYSQLPFTQLKSIIYKKTNIYKEELIQKTWEPSRLINWCLDHEESRELT